MRRFYRSRENKIIAGVCGGIAERYSFNPNLVRIFFIALVGLGGLPMLVIYIVLWMMWPVGPS